MYEVICSNCNPCSMLLNRMKHDDGTDVHDFGVILLEMIKGRSIKSKTQVEVLKDQVKELCFCSYSLFSLETPFTFLDMNTVVRKI